MSNINILPPQSVTAATVVNFSAGTASGNLASVVFSNSNGVSFGLNGSTITASAAAGGGGMGISAGTQSVSTGTMVFSNSNGITFGMSGSSRITASHNGLTSQSTAPAALAAGTQTAISGTIVFSDSNGISFGMSGSTRVTASHNGLTSQSNQALSGSNGSFTFQTATFGNLNGASFYTSNGSLVASYTVPTVPPETPFGISAGTQSVSTGTMVFADSNGISFGMSGSSRITASYTVPAAQTNQTAGLYAVSNTTQSSSGTQDARSLSFAGAGIASVGVTNGSVVISVPVGAPSPVNFSAGTTSSNLGSVVFSNSNGVSFGLNGATITASAGGGADITMSTATLLPQWYNINQSSSSLGQNSVYFWPFRLYDALYLSNVFLPILITNSSSAIAQCEKRHTVLFGLYSRHSTNSTVLTRHYSTSWSAKASFSSNTSASYEAPVGMVNSTSYSVYSASQSNGITISGALHGARVMIMPVNTTLTKGEWWIALHNSTDIGVAAGNALNISFMGGTHITNNVIGLALASSNHGLHRNAMMGAYSVSSGALPSGVSQTMIRAFAFIPVVHAYQESQ